MISTGINTSHWSDDDARLAEFVDVALLVVVTVVA
jgi:hypothetical protein